MSRPIKVAHIYASKATSNSGDFLLGISTKRYFKEIVLGIVDEREVRFSNFDCRDAELYNPKNVHKLNEFDHILVGGGGLILPDSAPNQVSCWQWVIPEASYDKIVKPIHVVSIGYNLFYGQTMEMTDRRTNRKTPGRIPIFKSNIVKLINRAERFSMRHRSDIDRLCQVIGEEHREKIDFEFCPVNWYVEQYWKVPEDTRKYIGIEIKDDRQWRRYHKIGIQKYYSELTKFVKHCIVKKIPVLYMSHDGSRSFYQHLKKHKLNIPYLDNSCANETKIRANYSKVHTLLCSAGHSQMIANSLGIKIISMVSHPKLKGFCDDIDNQNYVEINRSENVFLDVLRKVNSQ